MALVPDARSLALELLDGDRLDLEHLRVNLREMAMLNRLPGGVADSVRATRRLLGDSPGPRVLDAGAGSGDYVKRLRRAVPVVVTACDLRLEVLAIAAENLRGLPDVTLLQADVRLLPLDDESHDVSHASLLVHHLDPPEVVTALREMRRVARRGVVVNDLRRGSLAFVATAAIVLAFSRGRYTRHDGVLSARRAYTLDELDDLAGEAGLRVSWRTSRAWPRVTTVFT